MIRNIALIAAFSCATLSAFAQDSKVAVTGKVVDDSQHPVAHALVIVLDKGSHKQTAARTDHLGHYIISHAPSARCEVQVIPPLKSGYAQAVLPGVPAQEGRQLVVTVHKGFEVHGRVLDDKGALPGATVHVSPTDSDTIHGGGFAVTDKKGKFALVLTAGNKMFEVSGDRDGTIWAHRPMAVTQDGDLPDITVQPGVARSQ